MNNSYGCKGTPINLLRSLTAVLRARSILAHPFDMSRQSLCGSLHSGLLATIPKRPEFLQAASLPQSSDAMAENLMQTAGLR
jgi:hypothetical protein